MKNINLGACLNFFIFICFALGIIIGRHFQFFMLFLCLSSAALLSAIFYHKRNRPFVFEISLLLLFVFLGALWIIPYSFYSLKDFSGTENNFKLKVVSYPIKQYHRNSFKAHIERAGVYPVCQKVKAADYTLSMQYLNSYAVKGKIRESKYKKRFFYTLYIKKDSGLHELPLKLIDRLKIKITASLLNLFERNTSPEAFSFLSSVFLGRREFLGGQREIFQRAGASHLLAISGLHIGLSAFILVFFLRSLHLNYRASLAASLIFLICYTILTGASASTVRAVIMYLVFAISFFAESKTNPFNSLGLAGFVSLLVNPEALFEVGFQLSFLAVGAIILGFSFFPLKASRSPVANYLKHIFVSSLWVALFITPLVSYYFGRVYILSPAFNIIFIPFFTAILTVNFLMIMLSPIPYFAASIGAVISLLIKIFIASARFLGSLRFSAFPYTFTLKGMTLYYFFLLLLFFSVKHAFIWLSLKGKLIRK
ncbi:MAG: ComEC/Rec2 family competence protein [Candidatus Omnitrophota bacterium]